MRETDIIHTIRKLIQIHGSIYLDHPVSEFGLRYQHKYYQPMYYNFVHTVHELDSDNHDTEAGYDLDSMYTYRTCITSYGFSLTLHI